MSEMLEPIPFDDIVIGSSPLMLLQAGLLARQGRRVCLVERAERLGGSWRTAQLDNGEEVEIACHLIEVFPGAYELLEGASGVAFIALDLQPVRVHRSGWIVPYFSRVLMMASGVRLVSGLCRARLQLFWGRGDRNRLINFQTKLSSYLRHQMPAFLQAPVMQGPVTGFVDLINRLIERARSDGVSILRRDIVAIERKPDGFWHIRDSTGCMMLSHHVHCTTSTNLVQVTEDSFSAQPQTLLYRLCVVVDVPLSEVVRPHTYVAFWNDPLVARIARIDMAKQRAALRFLVEFHRMEDIRIIDLSDTVGKYLRKARIIIAGSNYQVIGKVNCEFSANVDQLPAGEIVDGFHSYYSMGNLAAGLVRWRKTCRIPPLPHAVYNDHEVSKKQ